MRILVIGGTGFIGSSVLHYLLDGGREILGFIRNFGEGNFDLPKNVHGLCQQSA